MKKHLIILFVFVAVKIFPQQINQPTQQMPVQPTLTTADYKAMKYKKMRNNGIILASVGGVALITGIAVYISALVQDIQASNAAATNYNTSGQLGVSDYFPQMFAGSFIGTLGGIAVAGGTTMAIIGNSKYKKWTKNRLSVVVAPSSFKIAYKF